MTRNKKCSDANLGIGTIVNASHLLAVFNLTSTHLRQALLSPSSLYTDGGTVTEKLNNMTKLTPLVSNRDDLNPELLPESMLISTVEYCSLQSVLPPINHKESTEWCKVLLYFSQQVYEFIEKSAADDVDILLHIPLAPKFSCNYHKIHKWTISYLGFS